MNDIKQRKIFFWQIASERELRRQRNSDMQILMMDTSRMTDDELEIDLTMKIDVKKRYVK